MSLRLPHVLALLLLAPALSGCLSFHQGALPGEPRNATFANVEGARVRYVDVGQGPAVVMIHGFASSLDVWDGVAPQLAKTHRVIRLDLKGFGWTDRPEGDYSPDAEVRIVLGLLDQRGVGSAAFVAHSWGSSVALAAALRAPERVSRLALYDAFVYEDEVPTAFHWARAQVLGELIFGAFFEERIEDKVGLAYFDPRYVTNERVDHAEEAFARPGATAAALAAVRGQRYTAVQARYPQITQPTLLLWGREDTVTPLKYGERLSAELPRAKLVVYPRCGHFPMVEAKHASDADLAAFLAEPAP